jgi:hypothetical protein
MDPSEAFFGLQSQLTGFAFWRLLSPCLGRLDPHWLGGMVPSLGSAVIAGCSIVDRGHRQGLALSAFLSVPKVKRVVCASAVYF